MRENTATLVHPETLPDGRGIWLAPEVQDLVDRLHHGDPTLGWEGDKRLALYRTTDGRWQLERLEYDGQYRTVCVSGSNVPLDNRLIMRLVAHDARRGFNPADAVDATNAAVQKERDRQADEKTQAATEKLAWALRKDDAI